ncbi:MAG: FAD binding domain-containing protein [Solirubrobacteraceae bacterium]|nr:FAD binding domain-containing protein [Solirubrobacteraceae bacterium]
MKPAQFQMLQPTTRAEALAVLAEQPDETVILAGGQSLVPLMNMRFVTAERILDLNRVSGLGGVEVRGDRLVVGAMTRHREAELSPVVLDACPLLAHAERHVGYVSIRNRGTVGGTIAHADTVAQVPCVAVALDARIVLESVRGRRELAAGDFFVGNLMNAREPDEAVTEVHFPVRPVGSLFGFAEFARKVGDFPLVTAAVRLEQGAGLSRSARIAVGGAGPTPVRLAECESALEGRELTGALAEEVGRLAADTVSPADSPFVSTDYRRNLVRVVVRRALEQALDCGEELR